MTQKDASAGGGGGAPGSEETTMTQQDFATTDFVPMAAPIDLLMTMSSHELVQTDPAFAAAFSSYHHHASGSPQDTSSIVHPASLNLDTEQTFDSGLMSR